MTSKEMARQVLESLPDDSTLDDIIHALYLKAKFDHGQTEIEQGHGLTDEQARARLNKWAG